MQATGQRLLAARILQETRPSGDLISVEPQLVIPAKAGIQRLFLELAATLNTRANDERAPVSFDAFTEVQS